MAQPCRSQPAAIRTATTSNPSACRGTSRKRRLNRPSRSSQQKSRADRKTCRTEVHLISLTGCTAVLVVKSASPSGARSMCGIPLGRSRSGLWSMHLMVLATVLPSWACHPVWPSDRLDADCRGACSRMAPHRKGGGTLSRQLPNRPKEEPFRRTTFTPPAFALCRRSFPGKTPAWIPTVRKAPVSESGP